MKLITEDNKEYIYSLTVYFVDETKGIKTDVCKVSNTYLSNSPYDRDEIYSYTISLFNLNKELYIKKEQQSRKGDETNNETEIYFSQNDGKSWVKINEMPTNVLPVVL